MPSAATLAEISAGPLADGAPDDAVHAQLQYVETEVAVAMQAEEEEDDDYAHHPHHIKARAERLRAELAACDAELQGSGGKGAGAAGQNNGAPPRRRRRNHRPPSESGMPTVGRSETIGRMLGDADGPV